MRFVLSVAKISRLTSRLRRSAWREPNPTAVQTFHENIRYAVLWHLGHVMYICHASQRYMCCLITTPVTSYIYSSVDI